MDAKKKHMQDVPLYHVFVYNFTDKGKSGRNLQLLANRGTAGQLFIHARSFDCPKRATCFGILIIRHRDNNRRENKHVIYKTLVAERGGGGILFSFLHMFM